MKRTGTEIIVTEASATALVPVTPPTQNVSQAEIDKFSALASRWWDPNSDFRTLHEINPLRLGWIIECLQGAESKRAREHDREEVRSVLAGKRCLDVGCGGGVLSEAMAREGAEVTGIDLSKKALTVARLHALESGVPVDYREITAEELARERHGQYDVVTCMEMLEHVPDPASVVQACADLVKPGGWVFFSTLNRNPKSFLFAIVGAEYVLNLLPRGTHQWESFIKPSELAQAIREADLTLESMTGLTYNPITRVYRLEPDTSVNYLVATRKPK